MKRAGDVVGYYPERGCYVVQLRGWQSPVVACAGETPVVGIGGPVRVDGVIARTVRQRQGPFLDVVPLIEGRVGPLRRQP